LFIAATNSSIMGNATELPGFPEVDSMLQFLLPASITQSALFSGLSAGTDTAIDLNLGFFDRLLVSPVARTSIIIGRLAGMAIGCGVQALAFIGIYAAFGVRVDAGVPGIAILVLYGMTLGVAIGGMATAIAFRVSAIESIAGLFPLAFVLLFGSSAFFPTSAMEGIVKSFAEINPVTTMIDGIRHQVITGLDWSEAALSLAIAAGFCAITATIANVALRGRIKRATSTV
ncbi:MAG TPA: ABC transporter permease, partial [Acidimicrobiales bacterium]|nr:ABC transporter permease [Acidimicrobiales bacterium]